MRDERARITRQDKIRSHSCACGDCPSSGRARDRGFRGRRAPRAAPSRLHCRANDPHGRGEQQFKALGPHERWRRQRLKGDTAATRGARGARTTLAVAEHCGPCRAGAQRNGRARLLHSPEANVAQQRGKLAQVIHTAQQQERRGEHVGQALSHCLQVKKFYGVVEERPYLWRWEGQGTGISYLCEHCQTSASNSKSRTDDNKLWHMQGR